MPDSFSAEAILEDYFLDELARSSVEEPRAMPGQYIGAVVVEVQSLAV